MKVTFVEGNPSTIKIVLDAEFANREEALTKMDEVHKEFKRLYPEHVVLVIQNVTAADVYILR